MSRGVNGRHSAPQPADRAALDTRIKDALDEARMVVLVVQVLLGFQFSAVLEHQFCQLSPRTQHVHAGGLALLLLTFALAVAPATFHRIAEHGNDTPRALRFTSVMISAALLPFAAAIGGSLFVVGTVVGTTTAAWAMALAGFVCALGFWYGWPVLHRRASARPARGGTTRAKTESPIESKIEHTLTEARMVLPGAQALMGFQFVAFFSSGFASLPPASRLVHFVGLLLVSLAGIILIAPAAFHRLAENGHPTRRFYEYASHMVQLSLVPLGMGMSADFYVVVTKVSGSFELGIGSACIVVITMFALWWGVPWLSRRKLL